jgi:hypothetical protein
MKADVQIAFGDSVDGDMEPGVGHAPVFLADRGRRLPEHDLSPASL